MIIHKFNALGINKFQMSSSDEPSIPEEISRISVYLKNNDSSNDNIEAVDVSTLTELKINNNTVSLSSIVNTKQNLLEIPYIESYFPLSITLSATNFISSSTFYPTAAALSGNNAIWLTPINYQYNNTITYWKYHESDSTAANRFDVDMHYLVISGNVNSADNSETSARIARVGSYEQKYNYLYYSRTNNKLYTSSSEKYSSRNNILLIKYSRDARGDLDNNNVAQTSENLEFLDSIYEVSNDINLRIYCLLNHYRYGVATQGSASLANNHTATVFTDIDNQQTYYNTITDTSLSGKYWVSFRYDIRTKIGNDNTTFITTEYTPFENIVISTYTDLSTDPQISADMKKIIPHLSAQFNSISFKPTGASA